MVALRNFPALIFGVVCLIVAATFLLHSPLVSLVFSWSLGLIGLSLFYERKQGWLIYIFSFGAGIFLLASMSASPEETLRWLGIFAWVLTQIILLMGTRASKQAAWSIAIFSIAVAILAQAVPNLPDSISKVDLVFLLVVAMSFVPTLFSFYDTSQARVRWEVLGLQALLVRILWITFGLHKDFYSFAVLDFEAILTGASVLVLALGLQTKIQLPVSVLMQTMLTLFIAQLSLNSPSDLSQLLLCLAVPLTLAQIIGPQIYSKVSPLSEVFVKLDCAAMGSPLLLALLMFAGYKGPESFPFLFISTGCIVFLSAQLWRERGPELQLADFAMPVTRIRLLSRYFFYMCALVMVAIECLRIVK